MGNTRTVYIAGNGGSFELAVNPKEISVTQESGNKTVNLLNVGEVVIAGFRGTIKTSMDTFLPSPSSPFYRGRNPEEIVQLIKKWKNARLPVRIIITGTDVNTMFLISSAQEKYKEGQTDIAVIWNFDEYRVLNVPASATTAFVSNTDSNALNNRSGTIDIPKQVTVKAGDSLWRYAVKYYGNGNRWRKIAQLNGITNPETVTVGMVVKLPEA